ncbi:MAG: winged helix-turn-helix transcriptional regulator [Armatimonadetes bacterium]|nr:winged helix-turn-helix transcriptional regulator [Armatimonadota bacterium]
MGVQLDKQETQEPEGTTGGCGCMTGMPDARFFKALCEPTRLRILAVLLEAGAPRAVSDIAQGFDVDVSVVSRHLAMLRDQRILTATRQGREIYYSVDHAHLVAALRDFAAAIEVCCPPSG